MRKWYTQLYDINRDLIAGYKIRCNNHQELMDSLKQVNLIIQKGGRLRGKNFDISGTAANTLVAVSVGKSKAKVISDCRNAIKDNNTPLLLRILKTGGDA